MFTLNLIIIAQLDQSKMRDILENNCPEFLKNVNTMKNKKGIEQLNATDNPWLDPRIQK